MPMSEYIHKVGIELEGAFHLPPVLLKGDGSVNYGLTCGASGYAIDTTDPSTGERIQEDPYTCYAGECVSRPYVTKSRLYEWIDKHMPKHVDRTCGTHLHISTNNTAQYSLLATEDFYNSFVKHMHEYGAAEDVPDEWFERLKGRNSYCEDEFWPNQQMYSAGRDGPRYTFLNYCWRLHGTMEIRVLPAFHKSEALIAAVDGILAFVDDYMKTMGDAPAIVVVNETPATTPKPYRKQRRKLQCV